MQLLLRAVILIYFAFSHISFAQDIDKNINWPTDMWPGITDTDTGLYSHLFKEIFTSQGFELQKNSVPFKRAIAFVDRHQADFAGGIIKDTTPSIVHIQAPFPVLTTPVFAFYKKALLSEFSATQTQMAKGATSGQPLNIAILKNYRVVASPQLGASIGLTDVYEVTNKAQAFLMVVKGRADFYIDNEGELLGTIRNNVDQLGDYDATLFDTSLVGYSSWYMISPKNSRGERVMQAYIKGTITLFNSGKLDDIYNKGGFIVPSELIRYVENLR